MPPDTMPTAPSDPSEKPPTIDYKSPRKRNGEFDPDHYRMTIGEHLEELRSRLVYILIAFVIATGVCLYYGRDVMTFFCTPLIAAQQKYDISPHLQEKYPGESFMVFIKISLITAAVITAPWTVYQAWKFVAAGLYPHERKYVTKYVPLSIGLLTSGVLFVYYLVLPWTLEFFIAFTLSIKLPDIQVDRPEAVEAAALVQGPDSYIQILPVDPVNPANGRIWFNSKQ